MTKYHHLFHIPVMGTGHSVDTPVRVAHLGISSVISLVDDLLLERIRKFYSDKFNLSYSRISANEKDGRAKRITAYFEAVKSIVNIKIKALKEQPFFENNDKKRYFELLPDESPLKDLYKKLFNMKPCPEREVLEKELTQEIAPGSIDANIMVKLDRKNFTADGEPLPEEFSDAKSALRGFAKSSLDSSMVFSAGLNKGLFKYITGFPDFYRNKEGEIKKKIILKVSDFRSALVQGRFLAKMGIEVYEYRLESGLNCGGHAFSSNGRLLPFILQEFKVKRSELFDELQPLIKKYYKKTGLKYPDSALISPPLVTVQGGIGINGEMLRLMDYFGIDRTGWATPFLLVPEATCVDNETRRLLGSSDAEELYLSNVSPLGISFNNIHGTGSEIQTNKMIKEGKPGSLCPKGFLKSNIEFSEKPICTASNEYQQKKIEEVNSLSISKEEKKNFRRKITEKTCICSHLGNGALINLGIARGKNFPQSICPGPNIAWFDRDYSLEEMIDHIYGRRSSLVSEKRPHMFAKEIELYMDFFEKEVKKTAASPREIKSLNEFKTNLEIGMDFCFKIAQGKPYKGENLASLSTCVKKQKRRLNSICINLEKKISLKN